MSISLGAMKDASSKVRRLQGDGADLPYCFGHLLVHQAILPNYRSGLSVPYYGQDMFDHDKDRNLQFRGAVSTGFFQFSPVDFFSFFSRFSV